MSTDEIAASSEEISASAEDMAQISQRSSDRTDRVKRVYSTAGKICSRDFGFN